MSSKSYSYYQITNEAELVRMCLTLLTLSGHFVWRNNTGVVNSSYTNKSGIQKQRRWKAGLVGSSDILGIAKDGKFIAIECKYGKNTTTTHQEIFLSEIRSRGGYGIVAYTIDDIKPLCQGVSM